MTRMKLQSMVRNLPLSDCFWQIPISPKGCYRPISFLSQSAALGQVLPVESGREQPKVVSRHPRHKRIQG